MSATNPWRPHWFCPRRRRLPRVSFLRTTQTGWLPTCHGNFSNRLEYTSRWFETPKVPRDFPITWSPRHYNRSLTAAAISRISVIHSLCSWYHGQTSLATYPGPNRLHNRHTYLQYPFWSSGIPSRINFSVLSTFSLIAIRKTASPNCSTC